ncbi:hypothetical protein JD844_021332 [Phrynosoma platyrhinos]|uniref:Uncharacterized protein n=1 Tax=Phrynosoma platyrhinos TaxID=52577 RepID=A0ABQ7STL2_PHRPL|nr:hypothetical protein JD844_021332 [Phrynosoma platyrhinos]
MEHSDVNLSEPWLEIPPNPWTQRAFLEALEIYNAEKEERAKKAKAATKQQEESKVIKKSEETMSLLCYD